MSMHDEVHGRGWLRTGAYILAEFIFGPPPTDGVLDLELYGHALFAEGLGVVRVFFLLFWTDVGLWMEGLGVKFDKVWPRKDGQRKSTEVSPRSKTSRDIRGSRRV